jgi:hypothetical protein
MNDTRGLYVNLETLDLSYHMKTKMENNPRWQNITDIFQGKVSAFDLQTKFAEAGKSIEMTELKKPWLLFLSLNGLDDGPMRARGKTITKTRPTSSP